MKVTYSPLVQDAKKRFGDLTVTSWKGQPVVRRFKKPSNPQLPDQQRRRVSFANLMHIYNRRKGFMNGAWVNASARLGNTARALWLKENIPLLEPILSKLVPQFTPGDPGATPLDIAGYYCMGTHIAIPYYTTFVPEGYTFQYAVADIIPYWDPFTPITDDWVQVYESYRNTVIGSIDVYFNVQSWTYFIGTYSVMLNAQGETVYSRASKYTLVCP